MSKMKTTWKSIVSWFNKYGDFNPLLKSRLVLYFLFLISLANLYTFVSTGNAIYAAVFILVGFLTTFFSKNMIVIMMVALAVSNVFLYGKQISNIEEGFDTTTSDTTVDQDKAEASLQKMVDSGSKGSKESKDSDTSITTSPTTTPAKKGSAVSVPTSTTATKGSKDKKPQPTPAQVEQTKADLKGLLDLEMKLMQGVSEMQPLLDKAKDTILQLKQNLESPSSSA